MSMRMRRNGLRIVHACRILISAGQGASHTQEDAIIMSNVDVTPKAIAADLGISPKRLRAFMRSMHRDGRSIVAPVGQGNRYGISKGEAARIKAAWLKAHAPKAESAAESN